MQLSNSSDLSQKIHNHNYLKVPFSRFEVSHLLAFKLSKRLNISATCCESYYIIFQCQFRVSLCLQLSDQ